MRGLSLVCAFSTLVALSPPVLAADLYGRDGAATRVRPGNPTRDAGRSRTVVQPHEGSEAREPLIAILCYHDVAVTPKDYLTVTPEFLRTQIRSAQQAGWTFLSLSELVAQRDHPERLPERTMVLTFDDGYQSFAEVALPILREEGVRATLAVITSFAGRPPPDPPPTLGWKEIVELSRAADVEIVSHSHDLHRWVTRSPYRDTGPSVTTRRYLLEEARYENRDEYHDRIEEDLNTSSQALRTRLGRDVSVLAWPFGEHNRVAREAARRAGFVVTLGLGGRAVTGQDLRSGLLPRVMVTNDMTFAGLDWLDPGPRPVHAAQVDLDDVFDRDPDALRRNVDDTVARVRAIGATHVFLQACPDPEGDGRFRQTYFVNHQVPVRADIWSMVASRFRHAGLKVWVRAPSMNLSWIWDAHPEWRIPFQGTGRRGEKTPWYYRVSPELPQVRRAAIDFFTDLGVYLPIDGVLFDDDAYMLPGEMLNSSHAIDPAVKSEAIHGLIADIQKAVREWRPECRFGRNLYAPALEISGIHPGFAQEYERFLGDYDLTVVMAYAWMEGRGRNPERWVQSLARRASQRSAAYPPRAWHATAHRFGHRSEAQAEAPRIPGATMFKLQAYDWRTERWVPGETLQALARAARRAGTTHLGVYPVAPREGEIPDHLFEAPPRGDGLARQ